MALSETEALWSKRIERFLYRKLSPAVLLDNLCLKRQAPKTRNLECCHFACLRLRLPLVAASRVSSPEIS